MARQVIEPAVWLLFSAGGMLAALVLPALALLFGVAVPTGWVAPPDSAHLLALLRPPLVRLGLFAVFALSLVHAAHRLRYTLYDGLQIKHLDELINPFCYGGAVAGAIAAALVLWRL